MLVRFSVSNFRSFNEMASFSMVANNRISRFRDHTMTCGDTNLLKTGFLYGANASGKSNLVKAVDFARRTILRGEAGAERLNQYFKINKDGRNTPGVFQFDIALDSEVYSYGFALSYQDGTIVEEWLYRVYKNGSESKIFERNEEQEVTTDLNISGDAKRRFDVYRADIKTMPKRLFLSEIAKKNVQNVAEFHVFNAVHGWFTRLIVIFPDSEFGALPIALRNQEMKKQFQKFLKHFDTGVDGIKVGETTLEKELAHLPPQVASDLEQEIMEDLVEHGEFGIRGSGVVLAIRREDGKAIVEKLLFRHGSASELFEIDDESDGTKRLFDLVPLLFATLTDAVVFIDEIDRSMHPQLTLEFVRLFYDLAHEKQMQLIATTHESALMDLDKVRQDEIWFVERGSDYGSTIYSLDKFKVRYDKRVEKDYLLGRYGAIPLFSSFDFGEDEEGRDDQSI